MALVGTDLYSRDAVSEIRQEILPDGTVHNKITLTRSRTDSVEKVEETIETFEAPPHLVKDSEDIEEVKPDGTKVTRHVELKSVVHSIKTHHETEGVDGKIVEDCDLEEVIPNTVSAFDAGVDSDYEEELQRKQTGNMSNDLDTEMVEEIQPDGTKVVRKITLGRVIHAARGRSDSYDCKGDGHMNETFPVQEVVPGTLSAFDAGQDSD